MRDVVDRHHAVPAIKRQKHDQSRQRPFAHRLQPQGMGMAFFLGVIGGAVDDGLICGLIRLTLQGAHRV